MKRWGIAVGAIAMVTAAAVLGGCAGRVQAGSAPTVDAEFDRPSATPSVVDEGEWSTSPDDPCAQLLTIDDLSAIWPDTDFSRSLDLGDSTDVQHAGLWTWGVDQAGGFDCGWGDGVDQGGSVRGVGITVVPASIVAHATTSFACDESPRYCSADLVAHGAYLSLSSAVATDATEAASAQHGGELKELLQSRMTTAASLLGSPVETRPLDCAAMAAAGDLGPGLTVSQDAWETQDGGGEIVPQAYIEAANWARVTPCVWSRKGEVVYELWVRDGLPEALFANDMGESIGSGVFGRSDPSGYSQSYLNTVAPDGAWFQLINPHGSDMSDLAPALLAMAASR